jgi:hypothetical protein
MATARNLQFLLMVTKSVHVYLTGEHIHSKCIVCCFALIFIYYTKSRDSSVSIVTRLRVGCPAFDSRQGQGLYLRHRVHTDPGATQPPTQWV